MRTILLTSDANSFLIQHITHGYSNRYCSNYRQLKKKKKYINIFQVAPTLRNRSKKKRIYIFEAEDKIIKL